VIKINLVINNVIINKGIAESKTAPIAHNTHADKSNLPLSLISGVSDFKDWRENKIPVIKSNNTIKMR